MSESVQKQLSVKIKMLNAPVRYGVRTGNNAAWLCVCKYGKPLLGHTLTQNPVKPVLCKNCGKRYKVVPEEGKRGKRVKYVKELR